MRIFLRLLILFLILGLGSLFVIYLNAPHFLAHLISQKAHLPVSIEGIKFEKERITIKNLEMKNPKEAQKPIAFQVDTIDIKAPYLNYFKAPIVIDTIQLDHLHVNIQLYNKERTKGNWQTIIQTMEHDHRSVFSVERKALIKKLILTDLVIELILDNGKVHLLSPIKRIELDDITSEEGIPTYKISEIVMRKMIASIFLKQGLQLIFKMPVKILKQLFPFFTPTTPAPQEDVDQNSKEP